MTADTLAATINAVRPELIAKPANAQPIQMFSNGEMIDGAPLTHGRVWDEHQDIDGWYEFW